MRILLLYSFFVIIFMSFGVKAQEFGNYVPRCQDKIDCLNNPECFCYCSGICEFRMKEPGDDPVYIANDPYGHYCYCKQWDIDVYHQKGCAIKERSGLKPQQISGVKGF